MAGVIRPQNKQIIDPQTNRLTLEWDAYFARLEALAAGGSSGGVTTFEGRSGVVVSVAGDYTASEITNVQAGDISAVNVQAALNELDSDKLPASDYTALDVLAKLLTVDGSGSGLDADTLDGLSSADFQPADADLTDYAAVTLGPSQLLGRGTSGPPAAITLGANMSMAGTVLSSGRRTLPGRDGDQGDEGERGLPGKRGTPGVQGSPGAVGARGKMGPPGLAGDDGGTGDRIPGRRGLQGLQGIPGITGAAGSRRAFIIQGGDGEDGERGIPGRRGANGTSGGGATLEPFTVLASDFAATNTASAQPVFAPAQDTLAVAASTTYEFEAFYNIQRSVATTHTTSFLFAGTATFTSIDYVINLYQYTTTQPPVVATAIQSQKLLVSSVSTAFVMTPNAGSNPETLYAQLRGIMRINAGGTVIPQFQFSGGSAVPTVKRGSFFRARAIGNSSFTSTSDWT